MDMTEDQYELKDTLDGFLKNSDLHPDYKREVLNLLISELPNDEDYSDE